MVLNTPCYKYLWLTMWFHTKRSKEMLKKLKSLILLCKFGSRAQKWWKIAKKKTDHLIAIYSIFCIGMVYFRCFLVNLHVKAVQNICGKGGVDGVSGWVRGGKVYPVIQKKRSVFAVSKKIPIVYGKKWFKFEGSFRKLLQLHFLENS